MSNFFAKSFPRRWLYVLLIIGLELISNDIKADDETPRFMSPHRHSGATDQQNMAYGKGALESIVFGLYSQVDRSLPSYQELVDCYKENFELINRSAVLPWVLGENLKESLAHNIYHRTTPIVCRDHKYIESKLQQRTLKITHLTEWNSWSVNEKIYYVGGYLDAGITILQVTSTSQSTKDLERLKRNKYDDVKLREVVKQIDTKGLELNNPIPWSVALSFGKVFGNNPENIASEMSVDTEMYKTGEISMAVFGKYVDFKILEDICKPHFIRNLTIDEQVEVTSYAKSFKCAGEKSVQNLIRPFLASQGLTNDKLEQISRSLNAAYDEKLIKSKSAYEKIGEDKTKAICLDLIRNNKYSEYLLADAYDVMKYQFGRLKNTRKIFDDFEQSTKSCPQIFSIGNKVRTPKFLQK
jgi:hypothetical protein